MRTWPVQDAKARFSEMLEACLREGPQIVSRRGTESAVLVPIDAWRRMEQASRPTAKEVLLSDRARGELNIPPRGDRRHRAPPNFD